MRNKEFRRFQEKKKKNWAKKLLKILFHDIPNYIISAKEIGRRAHTPQPCSCNMCGNPRKHCKSKKDKLTIQELKEEDRYKDNNFIDEL